MKTTKVEVHVLGKRRRDGKYKAYQIMRVELLSGASSSGTARF